MSDEKLSQNVGAVYRLQWSFYYSCHRDYPATRWTRWKTGKSKTLWSTMRISVPGLILQMTFLINTALIWCRGSLHGGQSSLHPPALPRSSASTVTRCLMPLLIRCWQWSDDVPLSSVISHFAHVPRLNFDLPSAPRLPGPSQDGKLWSKRTSANVLIGTLNKHETLIGSCILI